GLFNCRGKAHAQSGLGFIVENDFGKKLEACRGDEPRAAQRASRLASANTLSAEIVGWSLRSKAATRSSISRSQASSISASGASRSESSRKSASLARSSGDKARACV